MRTIVIGLVVSFFWSYGFAMAKDVPSREVMLQETLDRAEMYYWIALEESGDVETLHRSRENLKKAKVLLERGGWSDEKKELWLERISRAETDVEEQIKVASDTLYGIFPLSRFLYGYLMESPSDSYSYEIIDDSDVMATVFAAQKLVTAVESHWKNLPQQDVLFNSTPYSPTLENEALNIFNRNPKFFVYSDYALSKALTPNEIKKIKAAAKDGRLSANLVDRICEQLKIPRFLVVTIREMTESEGIYFFKTEARLYWKASQRPGVGEEASDVLSSMGFSRDRRPAFNFFMRLQIGIFIIVVSVWLILLKFARQDAPLADIIKGMVWLTFFFIIGRVLPWAVLPGMQTFRPPSETLAVLGFWWVYLAGLLVMGLPLLLALAAVFRLQFFHPNTPSELNIPFLGAFGGASSYLAGPMLIYLGTRNALPFFLLFLLSAGIPYAITARSVNWTRRRGTYWLVPVITIWSILFLGAVVMALAHLDIKYLIISATISVLSLGIWVGVELELKGPIIDPLEKWNEPDDGEVNQVRLKLSRPTYQKNEVFESVWEAITRDAATGLGLVLVSGPAGTGKTRLLEETYLRLKQEKPFKRIQFLYGEGWDSLAGHRVPFGIIRNALKSPHLERLSEGNGALVFKEVGPIVENLIDSLPGGGLALSVLKNIAGTALKSDGELRSLYTEKILDIAKASDLTVLCLDDAHFMDSDSISLIGYLVNEAKRKRTSGLVLLLAVRTDPEDSSEVAQMMLNANALHLRLDALSRDLAIKILRNGLRFSSAASERLLDFCISESPGSPDCVASVQWMLETTRYLLNQGMVKQLPDGQITVTSLRDVEAPMDIDAVIDAQIHKLSNEDFDILCCASYIGKHFEVDLLARTLKIGRMELVRTLDRIESETGLIQDIWEEDDFFSFETSAIVNAFRRMAAGKRSKIKRASPLKPQIVREYNRRIASALEADGAQDDDRIFRLAWHSYLAGSVYCEKTLKYTYSAAQAAWRGKAVYEANRFTCMFLELASNQIASVDDKESLKHIMEMVCLRLDCLMLIRADEKEPVRVGMDWIRKLQGKVGADSGLSRIYRRLALALYNSKDYIGGLEQAQRAFDLARDINILKARALHVIALCYWRLNPINPRNVAHGLELLEQAEQIVVEAQAADSQEMENLEGQLAALYDSRANMMVEHHEDLIASSADTYYRISLDIKEMICDLYGQAITHGGLGRFYLDKQKKPDIAMHHFKADLDLSNRIGNHKGQVQMHVSIGDCLAELGRLREASEEYYESLELALILNDCASVIYALCGMVETNAAMGNTVEADEYGNQILDALCLKMDKIPKKRIRQCLNRLAGFEGIHDSWATQLSDLVN